MIYDAITPISVTVYFDATRTSEAVPWTNLASFEDEAKGQIEAVHGR